MLTIGQEADCKSVHFQPHLLPLSMVQQLSVCNGNSTSDQFKIIFGLCRTAKLMRVFWVLFFSSYVQSANAVPIDSVGSLCSLKPCRVSCCPLTSLLGLSETSFRYQSHYSWLTKSGHSWEWKGVGHTLRQMLPWDVGRDCLVGRHCLRITRMELPLL